MAKITHKRHFSIQSIKENAQKKFEKVRLFIMFIDKSYFLFNHINKLQCTIGEKIKMAYLLAQ